MESLNAVLDLLTGPQAASLWILFLLGAILGVLITWMIWRSKVNGLRTELENANVLSTQFEAQATAAEEETALKESDLKKAALENIKLRQEMKRLSDEFAVAKSEMVVLNEHVEKSKTEGTAHAQQIESLENQILGLKVKNTSLIEEAEKAEKSNTNVEVYTLKTKLTKINSELATALVEVKKLEGLNEDLKKDRETLKAQLLATPLTNVPPVEELDAPIAEIDDEIEPVQNISLAASSDQMVEIETVDASDISADAPGISAHSDGNEQVKAEAMKDEFFDENFGIEIEEEEILPEEEEEVKVKLIPIAKKPIVNEKEIPAIVELVDSNGSKEAAPAKKVKLAAKKPLAKKKPKVSKKKFAKKTLRDDLKKVEGIGPKIEQLLNTAGILNWTDLAKSKQQDLRKILADAGNRYKMHDPTTWPEQSALAAEGEWDKLKTLQDFLKGGKDVSK